MIFHAAFVLSLILSSTAVQLPFRYNEPETADSSSSSYQFKWPIRKVAIVGAGAGGLVTYREFTRQGFQVRVFERDSVPGGNWHYTEEVPIDAPIPNLDPSIADFRPSLPPEGAPWPYEQRLDGLEPKVVRDIKKEHRAPKPIFDRLNTTNPKQAQQFREYPWPDYAPISPTRNHVQRYIRSYASYLGINSNDDNPDISYNTRVERVDKRYTQDGEEAGWTLILRQVTQTGSNSCKIRWWTEDFDAVVVASGRYGAPNIPRIQGIQQWANIQPNLLIHSRQYRRPEAFANQSVLVIGGSVSGPEIAQDISVTASKVYLSVRASEGSILTESRKRYLSRLPQNVSIVQEIKSFHPLPDDGEGLRSGVIEFVDSTLLRGIDRIIFGTGYRYGFPFLPQFHSSSLRPNETIPTKSGKPQPLVTDGTHIRSLHLDIFYIEEPTIGFINGKCVNNGIDTFSFSEYTSSALAKVWAGHARIPSTRKMWDLHWKRLEDAGGSYGKSFLLLGDIRERERIRQLVGWLNQEAVEYGGHQLSAPAESRYEIARIWAISQFPAYFSNQNITGFTASEFLNGNQIAEAWSLSRDDW
ncbi:hypothetical protein D9757_005129 [Collybiopsis confluens]|uniref:FAD/NAD(P)-binding domain-containing protein n=1 Tax=Collybiopsis confluens TaxID=2823264 RepID=A0A8H5HT09_9AGAR|nr:hypothetical protein D9757_005129 [Collybiopsis confluens]